MTLYGIDISDNQAGLSIASVKQQGFSFVTARALSYPNGRATPDPAYAGFRDACRAQRLAFAAYALFHTQAGTPGQQAGELAGVIGDSRIPVMLDAEPDGSSVPSLAFITASYDACILAGLAAHTLYLPHWYWLRLGSPDLSHRPWRVKVVNSNYVQGPGFASVIYPGDTSPGWAPLGGLPVDILQFADNVTISGYPGPVDGDAYRGTLPELIGSGMFTDWSNPVQPQQSTWVDVTSAGGEQGWQTILEPVDTHTPGTAATRLVDIERRVNELGADIAAIKAHFGIA